MVFSMVAIDCLAPSFRGDAEHRTRNLEVPGSRFARPGTTAVVGRHAHALFAAK
jgi:hypothetical protein